MTEPIAKLRLSGLSKARSPSPLPSPLGRGSIIDKVFVLVLIAFAAFSAPAAPLKIKVQLIWGTTNQVSPNAEHKAIGPELKKKLQDLPLKWTNYFEVKRIDVAVPSAGVATVPLSEKCRLEITDRGHSTIQVVLFGKGEKVINRTQALPKGETLILGGNAPGATSWFAVLRRLD